jgi:acetylornithine deacetylase
MLSELENAICNRIDQSASDIVVFLQSLVRCPTITPEQAGTASDGFRRHQTIVQQFLQDLEFSVESWEIDPALLPNFPGSGVEPSRNLAHMPVVVGIKEYAAGGRTLILNGHYDVVIPGDQENWSYPPFSGELVEGKIYGRGSCDMKGGLAAMLQALRIITQAGIKLKGKLVVQVVPEEEASCMGTLSACFHSDCKADAAIIPEPTNMNILVAMRGNASGTIIVYGRAGHADYAVQPYWTEGGAVNAIYKAVKVIQGLEELTRDWSQRPEKQHKYVHPDSVMPTVIHGGDWLVKFPEKVEIQYDANYIPSTKNLSEEIMQAIQAIANTDPWMKAHPPAVIPDNCLYGAEVSDDEPIIQLVREVCHDLGIEPKLIGSDSLTDAVHLINYAKVPTISIGPTGTRAHKVDEYIEISELITHTKILAISILRWCGMC